MKYRELTSSQKIFFVDKSVFCSTLWNQAFLLLFDERYLYEKINSALNEFISTQDGSRLRITETNGKPYSYITPFEKIDFEYHKLNSQEELDAFCKEKLMITYDLEQLLFRCYIVEYQGKDGVLFCAHHILCDGMGVKAFEIIVDRLKNDKKMEEYSFLVQIDKEESYHNSSRCIRDQKFWKSAMDTHTPALIYNASPEVDNYKCKDFSFVIPKSTMDKVREFCAEHFINMPAFFHTVLGVYFKRIKGKESFYLGIPLMNRPSVYAMNTLGLFIHVIPIFVDIKSDNLLNNCMTVLDTEMTAYRHQDFSSKDISMLMDDQVLYDVVVDYHTTISGYEYKALYSDTLSIGLEMHVEDTLDDRVDVYMRYRESIMNDSDLDRMAEFINNFLVSAFDYPETSVLELRTHNKEFDAVLVGEEVKYEPTTIYREFLMTANKFPDRICIQDGDITVSYLELEKSSQRIANELLKSGVKPNDVVAVFGDKSYLWIESVYGIIATGAGYMPLSPEYPDERLALMLKDALPTAIITETKYAKRISKLYDVKVICYDEEELPLPSETIDFSTPNSLAYVIYTSGTTGKPKGAMITNDSIVNRLLWMQNKYPLDEKSAILFKTPYTFDVSVWEIFWWSLFGAKVVICKNKDHVDVNKLIDYVNNYKITHIHFVPSMFRVFAPNVNGKIGLEHLFLSGEKLYFKDVEEFSKKYPEVKVHNLYGPTECAVDVTYYDVENILDSDLPVGKPIFNTTAFILDNYDNVVKIGEEGELCIAGKNVGLGYLRDEALTNEKFRYKDDIRYYRTGDIAKIVDGEIYFLGRKDGQRKINGQRLELDDIYANVKDVDGVKSAVVRVKEQRIYLFYVGDIVEEKVADELKKKLPTYMQPHLITKVESIPVTNHGKIDETKLFALISRQNDYVAPSTITEQKICDIFAKRLKLDKFSANANFIDEGASSIDVISVLCEDVLKGVSIDDVYTHPTPATLGAFIDGDAFKTNALIPLYVNKNSKNTLVLFPYAGAGAFSMHPLYTELKKILPDYSYYYVGWGSDENKVLEELNALAKENTLYFYTHCAGLYLAHRALTKMEKTPRLCIFAGIVVPYNAKKSRNIWRITPDFVLKRLLISAGVREQLGTKEVFKEVLQKFRRNAKEYFDYFKGDFKKITTKVALVYATGDAFEKDISNAICNFSNYFQGGVTLDVIESNTHYFCTKNAKEVAKIIKRRIYDND